MTVDHDYVKHLEQLVLKLIPVYDRYYKLTGDKKPPLENLALEKVIKKTPALLRAW